MTAMFEMPGQHRYEDMMLTKRTGMKEIMRVANLKMDDDDVIVSSYPKTGSTVLMEIVWLVRNNADVNASLKTTNYKRIPFIENNAADTISYIKYVLPRPRTVRTHVPWRYLPEPVKNGRNHVFYAIRNPKDTLVSYYHFYRMNSHLGNFTGTWNEFFNYMIHNNGLLFMGNPLDHCLSYWEHRDKPNVTVVFYENILRDREAVVRMVAEKLNVTLSEKQILKIVDATEFDIMKASPMTNMDLKKTLPKIAPKALKPFDHTISPFMRKGKIGDWLDYFTEEQNHIVDSWCHEKLSGSGLTFTFT